MFVSDFTPYQGQHCETTTSGNLLARLDIHLTEPMLFGLGRGLAFIYWDQQELEFPFVGGRILPNCVSRNIAKALGLRLAEEQTPSPKRAFANLVRNLGRGRPVGVKLDSYYLEYFNQSFHFPAHYVCVHGLDDTTAYLAETVQQGGLQKTSLESLAEARNAPGVMSSRNLSCTFEMTPDFIPNADTRADVLSQALADNARDYLSPPTRNFGRPGLLKAAAHMREWFAHCPPESDHLRRTALLMERGGTGGSLFRQLYRDFLDQCRPILADERVDQAREMFAQSAELWTRAANALDQAHETRDQACLDEAAGALETLADLEPKAMELLTGLAGPEVKAEPAV
ncbi:BtrH N-terminal domain-containing protein [Fundidesulfovibrio butyratiphilus]